MPIKSIIPTAEVYLQPQASANEMENLESCFDDLRTTKGLAEVCVQNENGTHNDVKDLLSKVNKVYKVFLEAISSMHKREGPDKLKACMKAYVDALDGRDINGKFINEWRNILSKKVSEMDVKCPNGKKCQFNSGFFYLQVFFHFFVATAS